MVMELRRRRRRRPRWLVMTLLATATASAASPTAILAESVARRVRAGPVRGPRRLASADGRNSNNTGNSTSSEEYVCPGETAYIANGACDDMNNNVYCGYDGGDCCSCTATAASGSASASASPPSYFNCVDPAAACVGEENEDGGSDVADDAQQRYSSSGRAASASDESSASRLSDCVEQWIGDGACDDMNNSAECSYDGGDCCSEDGDYSECLDPAALAASPSPYSEEEEEQEEGEEEEEEEEEEDQEQEEAVFFSSDSNTAPPSPSPPPYNATESSGPSLGGEQDDPAVSSSSSPPGASSDETVGNSKPTLAKAFFGIGAACVVASGVAFLAVSYFRLAERRKQEVAAVRRGSGQDHVRGDGGDGRASGSTPAVASDGF
ncbi:unnamed protein product, partial [Ectocarpus sp. 13 AM-2016]